MATTRRPAMRRHLSRLRRAAARVRELPLREQATLVHALAALVLVELLLHVLPLRRLAALCGIPLDLSVRAQPGVSVPPTLDDRARRAISLTRGLLRAWPWGSGPCLRESLVIGHLLRRRSPKLRLGVAGAGGDVSAHAWVEIDGVPLYGADGYDVFTDEATRRAG